ncbi:alpha/beta fold hydrolase [Nocardia sp. NBC_01009]|uniref:alpha/beta fold hydrolase n=1 Tax=Nocardia sp. NBC_01009 TaxID=2975996 RepID=UPI003867F1C9|nr:alpha/beta hydrolase [Nocardia sp. NBC_01009]
MTNNSMPTTAAAWSGMVAVEDTALAVTDTGGAGQAIIYMNGAYANQKPWKPLIAELGAGYRHITYDKRARGKSKTSTDYSFEACLRDVDAVLAARGVQRAILVGWSYGATLAAHWAERNPDRTVGMVAVDGAMPYGLIGDEGREHIRKLFHKMCWLFPICRPLGLAAKMSVGEHTDVAIEINQICAEMAPTLNRIIRPVRYVLASGSNLGGSEEEMAAARASLDPVLATNPHLSIHAQVPSNHSNILRKDFRAIADAVGETAAVQDLAGSSSR